MDHTSLPFRAPDLTTLSEEELRALRGRAGIHSREARKKSSAILGRTPALRGPWMDFLGAKESDPERETKLIRFEQALLRHPEAYLTYAHATALVLLDETLRAELARREMPLSKKTAVKKKPEAPVAPVVVHEEPEPSFETLDLV